MTAHRGLARGLTLTALALAGLTCEGAERLSGKDTTPPTVYPMLVPPAGGSATELFAGDYFLGDSIEILFIASDDQALRSLHWEVWPAGARGSFVVRGADVNPRVKIGMRPGWTGTIELRLYARDAAGLTSAVFTSPRDSLRVYPTIQRPVAWAAVNGEIRDAAIDIRRGLIYLLQTNQSRIRVLRMATLTVMQTVPLPTPATDLDLTPGGDSLIVVLPTERALGILDLRQASLTPVLLPLRALDEAVNQRPWYARVAANGKVLVSLDASVRTAQALLEVDLLNGAERLRSDAGNGGYAGVGKLGRSHDHSTLVLNGEVGLFQRYDAAHDAFGPGGSAIPHDFRPVVDGSGRFVAVGRDVYDESLTFLRRVGWPNSRDAVPATALSPDGVYLYMINGFHGIVRSRVSDGHIVDRTPNPIRPDLIWASPDGASLVTVESTDVSSKISVIDLR